MRARLALALALALPSACAGDDGSASGSSSGEATATAGTTSDATASTGVGTESTTAAATDTDATTGDADVWKLPYCYLVSDTKWLAEWIDLEDEVLARVNDVRKKGTTCGASGAFGPTTALTMEPHLRCAARVQSKDMAERDYLDHVNPEGEGPGERIDKTGYAYTMAGENIAGGPDNAADAVAGWLASDAHCAILMSPNWKTTGVGFYEGEGGFNFYWTQTFALPK